MPAANAPTEALLKASAAHNDAFERIGAGMQDIVASSANAK
jgi:hypothetical protein